MKFTSFTLATSATASEPSKKALETIVPSWLSNNVVAMTLIASVVLAWFFNKFGSRVVEFFFNAAVSKVIQSEILKEDSKIYSVIQEELKKNEGYRELQVGQKSNTQKMFEIEAKLAYFMEQHEHTLEMNELQQQNISKLMSSMDTMTKTVQDQLRAMEKFNDQKHYEFMQQMGQLREQFAGIAADIKHLNHAVYDKKE